MGELPTGFVIAGILAIVGGPTSAAWIGVRIGLNGVKRDMSELRKDVKAASGERGKMTERLAVIETKVSNLSPWNGRERRT